MGEKDMPKDLTLEKAWSQIKKKDAEIMVLWEQLEEASFSSIEELKKENEELKAENEKLKKQVENLKKGGARPKPVTKPVTKPVAVKPVPSLPDLDAPPTTPSPPDLPDLTPPPPAPSLDALPDLESPGSEDVPDLPEIKESSTGPESSESAPKPAPKPSVKPAVKPATKPPVKPGPKPATKLVPKPTAAAPQTTPSAQPVAKPMSKPVAPLPTTSEDGVFISVAFNQAIGNPATFIEEGFKIMQSIASNNNSAKEIALNLETFMKRLKTIVGFCPCYFPMNTNIRKMKKDEDPVPSTELEIFKDELQKWKGELIAQL